MGLREAGIIWRAAQEKANESVTITYRRGTDSVEIAATLGSQLLRTSDRRGGTRVDRTDRDFLFDAADLVLGGVLRTPQRADRIDLTISGVTKRYHVMTPGGSDEACWRYSDPYETRIRVHTKYMGLTDGGSDAVLDEDGAPILAG